MGAGASTADPSSLSPEEREKFIESMLHGEVTDLAATFAAELDRIHKGEVSAEEVKAHLDKSLSQRRVTIVDRIRQREAADAKAEAEQQAALSAKAATEAEARYAKQVTLNNANLMRRAAKTIMIGVDGSNSADMAFQVCDVTDDCRVKLCTYLIIMFAP